MWESWEKDRPSYNCRSLDPPTHTQPSLPAPCSLLARSSRIMKPVLSFTVLAVLLYFLAEGPSPVQGSSSVAEGFERFQEKLKELSDTVANKAKAAIAQLKHSEFSTKTRNWFTQNFQKMKEKMEATFSKKH
ncbi:apolipoprotein C-I isoform X2 [Dromiciops gliroides]|uniref:apolipoprotein C-I isoform X2 n=1 Tax=Dromiciops gliroides TaxID=33562 RepID=UPI001CC3CEEC|nr:apolipoprotein C-I isoform X2 [Dromiciops gliroides]